MEQAQVIHIRRSRDFGAMVSLVFDFLRTNFRSYFRALVVIVGPAALLAGLGQGMYMKRVMEAIGKAAVLDDGNEISALFASMSVPLVLVIVFSVIASVFLIALTVEYVRMYMERSSREIGIDELWPAVRRDFWNVLGTIVVLTVLIGLVFGALIGLAALTRSAWIIGLVIPLLMLGAVYLIIPLCFVIPVRLFEGRGIFAAARRSIDLTKGRWWFTFWFFVVISIIMGFLSVVTSLPMQIVIQLGAVAGATAEQALDTYSVPVIIAGTISGALTILLSAVTTVAMVLQYFNLVERRDGTGVIDRIAEIGTQPNPAGGNP